MKPSLPATARRRPRNAARPRPPGPRPAGREPAPPTPPPPPAPGEADTARILEAARAQFFTHGFHTITMDDLARDLGMSKKTLYRHFPSKEAVLETLLERLADSVGDLFREPAGGSPSPVPVPVPDRIRTVIAGIGGRLSMIQPVFFESLKRFAPRQFERLDHLRRRNLELYLLPLLRLGQARGEIRPDVDPMFAVEILLRTVHSLLDAEVLRRLGRTPAQAVTGVVDLILRGLLPPGPAGAGSPNPAPSPALP